MLVSMKMLIQNLFCRMLAALRERWYLQLELLALRHQLEVMKHSAKRPRFESADRWLWVLLSKWWPEWPKALEIVQADTVRRWRRQGIWHHLRRKRGRKQPGRPPIPTETRKLIREMSRDNHLWGAPRIYGELLKLGIKVSPTTVAKYMDRRPQPPSPTWRAFWRLHVPDIPVSEFYSEFSDHVRTVYKRVILGVWYGLCCLVTSRWLRSLSRPVTPINHSSEPDFEPVVRPLNRVEAFRAIGRSPPGYRWSSIDRAVHLNPLSGMGMVDVCLGDALRIGRSPFSKIEFIALDDCNTQRSAASEQAAA